MCGEMGARLTSKRRNVSYWASAWEKGAVGKKADLRGEGGGGRLIVYSPLND